MGATPGLKRASASDQRESENKWPYVGEMPKEITDEERGKNQLPFFNLVKIRARLLFLVGQYRSNEEITSESAFINFFYVVIRDNGSS